jgi:hypothetical protein
MRRVIEPSFAFFGALTSVGALFVFLPKEEKGDRK